ncbi:MAG: NAD(P)-dependent oxidoreductase [Chloroflexi bacterium]|nr:NAD(P)-dependent oxidoreductase [Chloroflexota bacterium]
MRIAVTGGTGLIGRTIIQVALVQGHEAVSIDRVAPAPGALQAGVPFIQADMTDYDALSRAFVGCDAVAHLGAIIQPFGHPDHIVHNNNVVGSYNALRAAVDHGIRRVCQASSVNALGLSYSRKSTFDYFPLDEAHPTYNEDPYSLSKWICEAQGDSFARRYEEMTISSMRFHWVIPDMATAKTAKARDPQQVKQVWAYTLVEAAAKACLLALQADYRGHEAFFITARDTCVDVPSLELAREFHPQVPVRGDLSGRNSFYDSRKAERMLGWTHA